MVIVAATSLRGREIPGRMSIEHCSAAVDGDGLADIDQRLRRLRRLLDADERGERIVGLELLFDLRELHELLGELVGIQRIERVLVLQLRGEQGEELLEVIRNTARAAWRWSLYPSCSVFWSTRPMWAPLPDLAL